MNNIHNTFAVYVAITKDGEGSHCCRLSLWTPSYYEHHHTKVFNSVAIVCLRQHALAAKIPDDGLNSDQVEFVYE